MAIRIPVYETHVALNPPGAPQISVASGVGEGLRSLGEAFTSVEAKFRQQGDQLEDWQALDRLGQARQEVSRRRIEEEKAFDPSAPDQIGQYSNNMRKHAEQVFGGWYEGLPERLQGRYKERVPFMVNGTHDQAALSEYNKRNDLYTSKGGKFDQIVAQGALLLESDPETHKEILQGIREQIESTKAFTTAQQRRTANLGATRMIGDITINAYRQKKQYDKANELADYYGQEIDKLTPKLQVPQQRAPGPQSLNQRRIDRMNGLPGVATAIEQAAEQEGFDPNVAKVVASLESGGNPRATTGSYHGLFQLSRVGFGTHGGGDIFNEYDNALAGVRSLKRDQIYFRQQMNRDPTATELYLMHQQGQGGAINHLQNPDQLAWQSMLQTGEGQRKGEAWAKKAVWGNVPTEMKRRFGSVDNITSGDFVAMWDAKVRGSELPPGARPTQLVQEQEEPQQRQRPYTTQEWDRFLGEAGAGPDNAPGLALEELQGNQIDGAIERLGLQRDLRFWQRVEDEQLLLPRALREMMTRNGAGDLFDQLQLRPRGWRMPKELQGVQGVQGVREEDTEVRRAPYLKNFGPRNVMDFNSAVDRKRDELEAKLKDDERWWAPTDPHAGIEPDDDQTPQEDDAEVEVLADYDRRFKNDAEYWKWRLEKLLRRDSVDHTDWARSMASRRHQGVVRELFDDMKKQGVEHLWGQIESELTKSYETVLAERNRRDKGGDLLYWSHELERYAPRITDGLPEMRQRMIDAGKEEMIPPLAGYMRQHWLNLGAKTAEQRLGRALTDNERNALMNSVSRRLQYFLKGVPRQ